MQTKPWFLGSLLIGAGLVLLSAGCGETPPRSSSGGDGGEGGTTSGAGGSSSNAGGGGAGQGGAGDAGGQGAGGGQGGAGGQGPLGDLLPLAVGYQWTYDVQHLGAQDKCANGVPDTTTVVLNTTTVDGKDGLNVDYFCSMPLVLRSDGDFVEFHQGSGWQTLFEPPVVEGHSWACYMGATCTWKSAGSITVPAGTFSNCWTAIVDFMTGEIRERTYCRGVGQVTSYYETLDGNGYTAKLVSKSF
jgi:hypothetical protein